MQVEINIPDDVAHALSGESHDISRWVLEAVALEGYRSRRISEYQVQRLLGFEHRLQVHAFLKANNTYLNYGVDDFEDDMRTLEALRIRFPTAADR